MKALKLALTSGAILVAGAMSASAALLDFTDDSVSISNISGHPVAPNRNESGPGAVLLSNGMSLVGDNDGIGVRDDEISNPPPQWVTITFSSNKILTAAYFLDVFVSADGSTIEEARVNVGNTIDPFNFFSAWGTDTVNTGAPGLVEITGLYLVGKQFTFWVGDDNDLQGVADGALAAIEVAPVPLPASGLLLLGAAGGLAALRRRKAKATA